MDLDYDKIDEAAKAFINEEEAVELLLLQKKDPNISGFSFGLNEFQHLMGAFRAGVEWANNKE